MSKKKSKSADAVVLSNSVSVTRLDQDSIVVNLKWKFGFIDRHKFAALVGCEPDAVELGFAETNDDGHLTATFQEKMDASQLQITFAIAELCEEKKKVDPETVKPWTMAIKAEFDVPLTKDEINAAANEAADLDRRIEEKQEALKYEAQIIKDDIKKMQGHKRRLVTSAITGRETKRVDCTKHFDPTTRTVWLEYRGEVQARQAMDITELKELQSRGGLFSDGVGGDPEKVVDRMNGDELAKRIAHDSALAVAIDKDTTDKAQQKEFNKKSKPPAYGVTATSINGDVKVTKLKSVSDDA